LVDIGEGPSHIRLHEIKMNKNRRNTFIRR